MAARKTAALEAEFEIVGNQLRDIVRRMREVEPASRRRPRNFNACTTSDIVRSFCSDILVDAKVDGCGGCLLCCG